MARDPLETPELDGVRANFDAAFELAKSERAKSPLGMALAAAMQGMNTSVSMTGNEFGGIQTGGGVAPATERGGRE